MFGEGSFISQIIRIFVGFKLIDRFQCKEFSQRIELLTKIFTHN